MNDITRVSEGRIFLSSPTMHEKENFYINEAFQSNYIAPVGLNIDRFEEETAKYVGIPHAAALCSGTAALHLALKLAGVGQNDKVCCSDLTFAASANPILYERGIPVFIDSERDTWNMDPRALEKAFKENPGVKAVISVNLYGVPAKYNEIKAICESKHVPLIEDAAESLGAVYCGRQTGTFGDYGIFSFNGNKIITTAGGGMLVSENEKAVTKTRFWATQSKDPSPYYQHSEIGYNYRMSNILAGIGRGQLIHLNEHITAKKKIYENYRTALSYLPVSMNPFTSDCEPNFWLSCILLNANSEISVSQIIKSLAENNIEARRIWKPMHMQPVFSGFDFIKIEPDSVSEDIFARGICLPSDIKMTLYDQERVISVIRSCFNEK